MPEKKNGKIKFLPECINFKKCDKYLKNYAYQGIINEEDWKDESNFTYDEACYIVYKLNLRITHSERLSKQEIHNANVSFNKINEKVNQWTEKYEKLLHEGQVFDPRSKGFKGPIL